MSTTEWVDPNTIKIVKEEVIDIIALEQEISEKQSWIDDYNARKNAMLAEKQAEVDALVAKRDALLAVPNRPEDNPI